MTMPPTERTARIVYFITSYRPPAQLIRLINALRHEGSKSPVVIHHDVFQWPLDSALLTSMPDVHILTSEYPIIWGDFSLEATRWKVFRWLLGNLDFDWVVLLSEQDYPIAPLQVLESRLAATKADAVIKGETIDVIVDKQLRREVNARYTFQYRSLPNLGIERRLPNWLANISLVARRSLFAIVNHTVPRLFIHTMPRELHLPSKIGIRSEKSPFTSTFPCWFNDSWFALSCKAVEHVIGYVDSHPELVRYYAHTMIPVESATGTIVFNDPDLEVENSSLTTAIWSNPKSGRPNQIGVDDIPFVLGSGGSFARKFDGENTEVLDELDKVIFRKN
jgi:hypothetical protein